MAIRNIVVFDNPLLNKISEPVYKFDEELKDIADDLVETMFAAPGVGLSGVQIGVLKRLIVVDSDPESEVKSALALVNPQLVWTSSSQVVFEEGCLSLPGYYADVKRPESIVVEAYDLDGNQNRLEVDGFIARIIQHEMDHLDGILFVDRLGRVKRDLAYRKLKKTIRLHDRD